MHGTILTAYESVNQFLDGGRPPNYFVYRLETRVNSEEIHNWVGFRKLTSFMPSQITNQPLRRRRLESVVCNTNEPLYPIVRLSSGADYADELLP